MTIQRSILAILLLLGLSVGGVEAGTVIRWGEILAADHPQVLMIDRIAKQVKERTNGRIEIQVFPAGQTAGSSREQVEAVALGTQEMTTEGAGILSQWAPVLSVIESPYIWRDADHLAKVMSGPIGQEVYKPLVEKRGIRALGTSYYGVRQLTTTRKAVRTVADMKEFKLRVPEQEVFVAMVKAWGAKATPMTLAEAYLALRQNVADGQENPLPTIDSNKFYEVQKYLVLTGHIITPRVPVINEKFWQRLSPADQKILSEAVADGISWNNQEILAREKTLVDKFKKAGMEVIQPDVESFRRPVLETVPKQFEARWGKGLFDRIVATK
jgi:tripartite ATP-independent transporter DctP family solute receptor